LHTQAALDEVLRQLQEPGSTNYRRYLTPDQFTARFGPTEAQYQAVMEFARTNGLAITATYSNRVVLDVIGSVSNIERAFHVVLSTYRHPTEPRTFYAPDTEPSVPADLPVLSVSGLSNFQLPKPGVGARPR